MDEATQSQSAAMNKLIEELGLANLPADKQQELVIKITEVLLKRIFMETMEQLGEEGREAYDKLFEGEVGPEKVEEFFKSRIVDYDQMVERVITEFKAEMMTVSQNSEQILTTDLVDKS